MAPAKQQDPAAIQATTPICSIVMIQMMMRIVMVSTMTKRIEMILMMFLVGIYFSGGGSCDGGSTIAAYSSYWVLVIHHPGIFGFLFVPQLEYLCICLLH